MAKISDVPILEVWDSMPHVIKATTDDPEQDDNVWDWANEIRPRDDGTELFIAEYDENPIGVVQSINPATERTHYWGSIGSGFRALDIWIGDLTNLGKGFGTQMMVAAIKRCFDHHKAEAILIDPLFSNTKAHRFYRRLGFKEIERRQFDAFSDCLVMRLTHATWAAQTWADALQKTQE